jgi:hypothetical protein
LSAARTATLLLLTSLAAAGCGSTSTADNPAPDRCIERWNEDSVARTLGEHAYDDHEIRRALVEETTAPEAKNVRAERTCLVVFAAQEGDPEEGQLGLVVTRFGWSQLFELGLDEEELLELQRSAADESNAGVFPDGSLG